MPTTARCWVGGQPQHHADIGGMAPGSLPPDATEIFQEGFRIPPVRWTPEVEALIVASSRTPDERRGDLDAQVGANRLRGTRLREELTVGADVLTEIVDYGERRVSPRRSTTRCPTASTPSPTCSTPPAVPARRCRARIRVKVTVHGDSVTFDFAGTDARRAGSVNAVAAVTVSSVVFLRSVIDPDLPTNGGVLRAVRVITEPGSIVAARMPVAVGAGNVKLARPAWPTCVSARSRRPPRARRRTRRRAR